MAYYGTTPVKVADGGTGQSTLVDTAILVGNTTSGISTVTPGIDGQLLISSGAGVDPVFGSTRTSATAYNFSINTAGITESLTISNTDNTNPSSNAILLISVGGSSAGDIRTQWIQNTGDNNYSIGADNSVTTPEDDPLTQCSSVVLGNMNNLVIQKSGLVRWPRNPCFLARLNSNVNNVTGAGGTYTLGSGTALTETFDQHGDLTTGGLFTAPCTGIFDIRSFIQVVAVNSSKVFTINIVTSNRTHQTVMNDTSLSGNQTVYISSLCDMDVSDTATITCIVTGEVADDDDIVGSTTLVTYMCGRLVA